MSGWKEYKFDEFVNINPKVSIPKTMACSYVEMRDLNTNRKKCFSSVMRPFATGSKFQNGDTLFARITPCLENGKICQVADLNNGIGCGSTEFLVFRGREKVSDTDFVYYLSRWEEVRAFAEANFDGTSGRQRVPSAAFSNLKLLLPDMPEQQAIASVLSSLDDKIDLLHRQNKILGAAAETLFWKLFIEKAELKWPLRKLGEMVDATLGGEWGKESLSDDFTLQVQCIRGTDISDLQDGLADRTPVRFIKESKYKNIAPCDGDLIMEISGGSDDQATGRTIYINNDVKALFPYPIVFSNFCRLIRPKHPDFVWFLYLYIKHLYQQGDFFNLENGSSGIRNFNYKALLYELEYNIPNDEIILEFPKAVTCYYSKIDSNKIQIRTLSHMRDTLLPKLMSGEVRVKA